jgi:hypothetical protein
MTQPSIRNVLKTPKNIFHFYARQGAWKKYQQDMLLSEIGLHEFEAEFEANQILENCPLLRQKISMACKIQEDQVSDLFADVLRFLACAAWLKERITPTKIIDDAWHEFILFTRMYADFCEKTFGRFIHHTPDSDDAANQAQFRTFEAIYSKAFPGQSMFSLKISESMNEVAQCGGCTAVTY